jgi:hypothetical protein
MVDPKEVSANPKEIDKGGFGAFAAKDWARRAAKAEAEQAGKPVASNLEPAPEPGEDATHASATATDRGRPPHW